MVLVGHQPRGRYYTHHNESWKISQRHLGSHAMNLPHQYAAMMSHVAYSQQQQQQQTHQVISPHASSCVPVYHYPSQYQLVPPPNHPMYHPRQPAGYYESYDVVYQPPPPPPSPPRSSAPRANHEPVIAPRPYGLVQPARPLGASFEKPTADAASEALAVSQLASLGGRKSTTTPQPTQLEIVAAIHLNAHGPHCAFHSAIAKYGARPARHKRPGDEHAHIDFILPDGSLDCQLNCCGDRHKHVLPQAVSRHFADKVADFTETAARRRQQRLQERNAATVAAAASRVLHPSACPQFQGPAHF